jgi:hypothetical protein
VIASVLTRQQPTADRPINVRRWLRSRQVAANGRVDPATVYCIGVALAMGVALVGKPAIAVVWPAEPSVGGSPVLALVGAGIGLLALFRVLRQLGPLFVSRSAATWLLPAPVSRRMLITPALCLVTTAAIIVGGLAGLAVAGRSVTRPADPSAVMTWVLLGSIGALLAALASIGAQRRPAAARATDLVAGIAASALVMVAVGARLHDNLPLPGMGWQPGRTGLIGSGVALLITLGAVVLVWHGADDWPTYRIIEASALAGTYADAVYVAEPSFLSESAIRRYWQRWSGFRPSTLYRRSGLPPLVIQDVIIAGRKASKLWWVLGTAAIPTVLADAPRWILIATVLLGALGAAGITTESMHSDRGNPAMLRLLGLTGRQVAAQRLVVPSFIGGAWTAVALGGLQAAGVLQGPWWLLGLAAGPAIAVATLQRAKATATSVGTTLIDTPMGAFPSGMLLWLTNGVDVLVLLTLPVSIGLATGAVPGTLGWQAILYQAAASALGCVLLIRWSARAAGELVN